MRVGFILQDKKRPRVLTTALQAHAAEHGIVLVSLNPSDPDQWEAEHLHAIVHKLPEDAGLNARLLAFQQQHPHVQLLDAPAAVQQLQDRISMMRPLAGQPLVLLQEPQTQHQLRATQHTASCVFFRQRCILSVPPQTALPAGCDMSQALQLLQAAGLMAVLEQQRPLLAKPVATATRAGAGHTLAAVLHLEGLQQLLLGAVEELQLPVVLQEFVPHGPALFKLYIIGPHLVLTARSTLTVQSLQAATLSTETAPHVQPAPDGARNHPGVLILNRISAEPLAAAVQHGSTSTGNVIALDTASEGPCCTAGQAPPGGSSSAALSDEAHYLQQQQRQQMPHKHNLALEGGGRTAGVALCDGSAVGLSSRPPMWAMQELGTHLRLAYGLNMFNVDIIAPDAATAAGAICIERILGQLETQQHEKQAVQGGQQQQKPPFRQGQVDDSCLEGTATAHDGDAVVAEKNGDKCYLVVDVNYFPGYDKVPGAERLFADFLSSSAQLHQ